MNEKTKRLAVLIDADNVSPTVIKPLLDEVAAYGVATVRRIYGDWTTPNLSGWKTVLAAHALQPIQQFRNSTGKNATDSAMIIDAMDLLHGARLDGFCLVSSDADFTRLASRIREHGLPVYGFGEAKTPQAFRSACTRFILTDILGTTDEAGENKPGAPIKNLKGDTKLLNLLRRAIEASADDSGWASLGEVGSRVVKQEPDFDSRTYGFPKLRNLIEAIDLFVLEERSGANGHKHLWLKDKRKKAESK